MSVNRPGRRSIVLGIRTIYIPSEDVVGRDVNEPNTCLVANLSQKSRGSGVTTVRLFRFVLAAVDVGERCRVDHQIGTRRQVRKERSQGSLVGDIYIFDIDGGNDLGVAGPAQIPDERPSELPMLPVTTQADAIENLSRPSYTIRKHPTTTYGMLPSLTT